MSPILDALLCIKRGSEVDVDSFLHTSAPDVKINCRQNPVAVTQEVLRVYDSCREVSHKIDIAIHFWREYEQRGTSLALSKEKS